MEDFVPPEPTAEDPYPGYYMTSAGTWAAYDSGYYKKFYDKWKKEYDDHVRSLEKGAGKGFENLETEGAREVNALSEMERAKKEIQEREERKALTTGGADVAAAPKMNIKVSLSRACLSDIALIAYRVPPLAEGLGHDINCRHCYQKHTRTGKASKRRLLKVGGTERKQATNTVSFIVTHYCTF